MNFSSLANRLSGQAGGTWNVHYEAVRRQNAGEDVILLTVGTPDQPAPSAVIEATAEALRQGQTKYAPILGTHELRAALARRMERQTGTPCTPGNIAVTAGAQGGLFFAMLAMAQAGDEVLVPEPMYATYPGVVAASGALLVPVPLQPDTVFQLDVDIIARAITPRTRVIWINSPNNPTGAVYDREAVAALGEICRRHGIWLLSDEVYADLSFGRAHASAWSLAGLPTRVVVSSLSKSHSMPGFRLGWIVGPEELIQRLQGLLLAGQYGGPPFVQAGALTAVTSEFPEIAAMRDTYAHRAAILRDALKNTPGCRPLAPQGGMFLLLDVRGTGLSAGDFAAKLLAHGGVALLPCDGFGTSATGHVRISLGAPEGTLREAARRIVSFCNSLSISKLAANS